TVSFIIGLTLILRQNFYLSADVVATVANTLIFFDGLRGSRFSLIEVKYIAPIIRKLGQPSLLPCLSRSPTNPISNRIVNYMSGRSADQPVRNLLQPRFAIIDSDI